MIPPGEVHLSTLMGLVNRLKATQDKLKQLERDTAATLADYKDLAERLIPSIMSDLQLRELRLATGETLKIQPFYYGSVAQERMPQAIEWLKARNMDGIVKREAIIPAPSDELLQRISDAVGEPVAVKATIHPSTLRSFVRERIEANDNEFPRELFAASVVHQAVVK